MRCPLPTLARAGILACCALPALAEGKGVLMLEVKVDPGHQGRIQEMLDLGEEVTVLCDVTVVPGPMTQPVWPADYLGKQLQATLPDLSAQEPVESKGAGAVEKKSTSQ